MQSNVNLKVVIHKKVQVHPTQIKTISVLLAMILTVWYSKMRMQTRRLLKNSNSCCGNNINLALTAFISKWNYFGTHVAPLYNPLLGRVPVSEVLAHGHLVPGRGHLLFHCVIVETVSG